MSGNGRIDANWSFTEIARELHGQFEKEGTGGGIRFDGKNLYVKGNSEFWDKYIGTRNQLKIRHNKFNNAVQALADALDREHSGMMVGNQSMGEYVFGNMLEDGGIHRLDEQDLIDLEHKVLMGLEIALTNARASGDQHTVELLKDRGRFTELVETHADDSMAMQRAVGWRSAAVGYQVMRQALAECLEEAVGPMAVNALDCSNSESGVDETISEFFLSEADDILADIGGVQLGLNESTIDKVLAKLFERPEDTVRHNVAAVRFANGLYDKIRMNNSIDVNVRRLSDLNDELQGAVDEASQHLVVALINNKNLIKGLELARAQGTIYNEATAKAFSDRLNDNARRIYALRGEYLHQQISIAKFGGDEFSSTQKVLSPKIAELAAGTHDLAKSLLPVGDRTNPKIQFSVELPVEVESGALQQDWILDAFHGDGALGARFRVPAPLYRSQESAGGDVPSVLGKANDTHNENLDLLREMYQAYLADPGKELLDKVRGMLDSALGSYYNLSANLQNNGRTKLRSDEALADRAAATLREQAVLLQKLSFVVDATVTKQTMPNTVQLRKSDDEELEKVDQLGLQNDDAGWAGAKQSEDGASVVSGVPEMFALNEVPEIGGSSLSDLAGQEDGEFANATRFRPESDASIEDLFDSFAQWEEKQAKKNENNALKHEDRAGDLVEPYSDPNIEDIDDDDMAAQLRKEHPDIDSFVVGAVDKTTPGNVPLSKTVAAKAENSSERPSDDENRSDAARRVRAGSGDAESMKGPALQALRQAPNTDSETEDADEASRMTVDPSKDGHSFI